MQCPDCGYMMTAFDAKCARCEKIGPPKQVCQSCGAVAPARDTICGNCFHHFGQPLPVPPMPATPAALYAAPPNWQPSPPPVAVNPIIINNGSNAGWVAAFMVLMLATPLGCLIIPAALICGVLVLFVGWNVWPVMAATSASFAVIRSPSIPQDKKVYIMLAILAVGGITEAVWVNRGGN